MIAQQINGIEFPYAAKMATEFGKRLLKARLHAGLTQVDLAKKAGMAQSTITAAETTGAGSRKTPQLAAICGVSAHWLATGEGDMSAGQLYDPETGTDAALAASIQPAATLGAIATQLAASLAGLHQSRRKIVGNIIADLIESGPNAELAQSIDQLAPDVTLPIASQPQAADAATWRGEFMRLIAKLPPDEQALLLLTFNRAAEAVAEKTVSKPQYNITKTTS